MARKQWTSTATCAFLQRDQEAFMGPEVSIGVI